MESPLSFFFACIEFMNPPLTPPRRGTGMTRTKACSPPGSGVGRFMESLHYLDAAHWDHESVWSIQSAAGPAHSKTWRKCARLWPTRQRLGVRRGSAAFDGSAYSEFVRFMEREMVGGPVL